MRSTWAAVPEGAFPFVVRCPWCLAASDTADVPMRLRPPEGAEEVRRTASLALRVYRAVVGAGEG
jgi:hypothetical protein